MAAETLNRVCFCAAHVVALGCAALEHVFAERHVVVLIGAARVAEASRKRRLFKEWIQADPP